MSICKHWEVYYILAFLSFHDFAFYSFGFLHAFAIFYLTKMTKYLLVLQNI